MQTRKIYQNPCHVGVRKSCWKRVRGRCCLQPSAPQCPDLKCRRKEDESQISQRLCGYFRAAWPDKVGSTGQART